MSTEHTESDHYPLSLSQARYYCRKPECGAVSDMPGYARLLEEAGIEVIDLHPTSLTALASQAQVWTALSGLSW